MLTVDEKNYITTVFHQQAKDYLESRVKSNSIPQLFRHTSNEYQAASGTEPERSPTEPTEPILIPHPAFEEIKKTILSLVGAGLQVKALILLREVMAQCMEAYLSFIRAKMERGYSEHGADEEEEKLVESLATIDATFVQALTGVRKLISGKIQDASVLTELRGLLLEIRQDLYQPRKECTTLFSRDFPFERGWDMCGEVQEIMKR